jgi:putative hemolysin
MTLGAAWFWVALAALAVGALLSTLFHALREVTRSKLEDLAQRRGHGDSRSIQKILADTEGHSTAVALPRIVCNMIAAVGMAFWVGYLRGEPVPTAASVAVGIGTASLLVWVFGLIVPHSIAAYAAAEVVYVFSWLIRASDIVQRPLSNIAGFVDEVVRRLAGKQGSTGAEQIEAELMSVVEEAQEEGQFDQTERDMIEAVVEFRSTTVEQIMTPRTEVEAMELSNNLGEITRFIRDCRHSRIPVFEGNLDHIVGMFYIKDLMRWLAGDGAKGSGKPFELRAILRPAYFVPETKTIRELLTELVNKKVHVAMVADEYGGTAGLVTLEDIVEEIFGEIQDEYEQAEDEAPVVMVSPDTRSAEIEARASVSDANEALRQIEIGLPEGEEYDTVGGLVITQLGRIPGAGEVLRVPRGDGEGDLLLTVLEAEPTRVVRVRVEVAASVGEGATAESDAAGVAPEAAAEGVAAARRGDSGK